MNDLRQPPAYARTDAPAAGCWAVAAEAHEALRQGALRVPLAELGVIAASGEDAARFLHGQLTGDVEKLASDRLALAGYCTPKGRLLATFRMWRDDSAVRLLLPRELLPGTLKRLSMFVLRARARLTDESDAWRAWAVLGAAAGDVLRSAFGSVPAETDRLVEAGGTRIARLRPGASLADRFLILAAAGADLPPAVASLPAADSGAFWWSEIDAGVATVFAATQERFVPQMVNFEVVGGVSFTKGCYPGQEVVARSQYRGKLRRRMQRAHCAAPVAAGADVFAAGEAEPVGTVVMAAGASHGGFDLLFECPTEKLDLPLHAAAPDGPALQPVPLPYEIVDVTA